MLARQGRRGHIRWMRGTMGKRRDNLTKDLASLPERFPESCSAA